MKPVILPPHQLRCFYQGGARIAALRGDGGDESWSPEEWIASTTPRYGEVVAGLSALPGGQLLREAIQADPGSWLGAEHVAAFGADPAILVKLLDAGERLPVHVHPTRDFSRQHLNCPYGKTEAWVVIEVTGDDPHVYLGFKDDVSAEDLRALVDSQDSQGFLDLMHRIPVEVGDSIVVPSGTPHATGAGVFVVELQEPTDFSILLEHKPFDIDGETKGHLGIGFDLALQAVKRTATSLDELASWCGHLDLTKPADQPQKTMPPIADPYFRADLVRPEASAAVPAGFGVLVVIDGAGSLEGTDGPVAITSGDVLAVPYSAGEVTVTGNVGIVWSRPPSPDEAGKGA
ncbi:MAG: mannose-6-phosphate isomerase [Cryptosporangiaceae bacterium]|nr:mannose-6-phosphate isomerase [Cryptosporangiaceae bacterium]